MRSRPLAARIPGRAPPAGGPIPRWFVALVSRWREHGGDVRRPLAGCGKTPVDQRPCDHHGSDSQPALRDTSPQVPQSDEVIRCGRKGDGPIDELDAPMAELAQATDGLHPPKDLFDELPFSPTHRVAWMPRRPAIDRTPACPSRPPSIKNYQPFDVRETRARSVWRSRHVALA
jgi:hypothetical protein